MFFQNPAPKSELEDAISELIAEMKTVNADSKEYAAMADNLVKLYKLKEVDHDPKKQLSYDAILSAGASIAGILIIVSYEEKHALVSKSIGFVKKFW